MTGRSTRDRKCYGQACTVSTALDVAGDRWTLLILRELLGGAARFEDLVDGLPGIARNLLTNRLRRLEDDGLVRRTKAAGTLLYAVTDLGAAVRPVIEELGFWGLQLPRVAPVVHPRSIRAIAMALQAILARAGDALPKHPRVIELDLEGEAIEVTLGPTPMAIARPGTAPDARIRVLRSVMSDMIVGEDFEDSALDTLSGDPSILAVFTSTMRAPFRHRGGG